MTVEEETEHIAESAASIAVSDAEDAEKAVASEKLVSLLTEYTDLMYWKKTDAELDTIVNGLFPVNAALATDHPEVYDTRVSCRVAIKQLAKGVADVVDVIEQLRILGVIPKE